MKKVNYPVIFFVVALVFLAVFIGKVTTIEPVYKTGIVVKKYEGVVGRSSGKRGYSESAYFLDVKYSDEYVTKEVTTNTWYRNEVGSSVTFKEHKTGEFDKALMILMVAFFFGFVSFVCLMNRYS